MIADRSTINLTPQQNTLEKLEGDSLYKQINLMAYWDVIPKGDFLYSDNTSLNNWLSFLSQYNFKPISEFYIAAIYCYLADAQKSAIPHQGNLLLSDIEQQHDKTVRKKRTNFLNELRESFSLILKEDTLSVVLDSGTDITEEVYKFAANTDIVQNFLNHRYVPNYITKQLKEFSQSNTGLVVLLSNSAINHNSPTIAFIFEHSNQSLPAPARMADVLVEDEHDIFNSTLSLILEHSSLKTLRDTLIKAISKNNISIVPALNKENWAEYPLMKYLKEHVKNIVADNIRKEPILCDPIDLEYQTLFRLTSYSIEDIFENGSTLHHTLQRHTQQIGWRGLTTLDIETVAKFKIRVDFFEKIVSEQRRLMITRLNKSTLPLDQILRPSGIFAEVGWVIQKNSDQYTLENPGYKSVPITFKEVDVKVAQAFHNDLHYIHTPRVWRAYGFYLKNENLPFSVLSIQPVDRTYKKNTLLLFGFDPRHCIEFTRLYSWPGVPKNVTSAIFGAMFSHLRKHEPRLEAAISAFMPSYASGLSMLTGGFNTPILSKEGVHYFTPKNVGGVTRNGAYYQ